MAKTLGKTQEIIIGPHGGVATDDGRCSQIAMDVLKGDSYEFPDAGNAIDAAVAAALSLGVVSLASSGIGGGAFVVLRLANGTTAAFDMRECAPEFSEDIISGKKIMELQGAYSIGVPGELAGLHKIWKEYGTLPWKNLVKPAEELARGFEISGYLHGQMVLMKDAIFKDEGLREMLTRNGSLLNKGDICYNIKLAETLKKISEEGVEPFYNGEIGEALTDDIQKLGGILKMKDMRNYKVRKRDPIVADISRRKSMGANISKLELICMPPPSAGGVGITLMINILNQYEDNVDLSSAIGIHRKIEALKHVFAMRLNVGDPDFVDCSALKYDMLSHKFAKGLKETIDDNKTFGPCHYGGRWNELYKIPMPEHGTSHFSIVDKDENAVAMTTSLNNHFGVQLMSRKTGIVLNNQIDDFSIPYEKVCPNNRKPANFISPGKRPLSSMSPTIVLKDGKLNAVVGGSGGILIIPTVAEVILNYYFKKMDELSSIKSPRCYPRLVPNEVYCENFTTVTDEHIEVPTETRASLKKKGHVLTKIDNGAVCQMITIRELQWAAKNGVPRKVLVGVSDPRKGGAPACF